VANSGDIEVVGNDEHVGISFGQSEYDDDVNVENEVMVANLSLITKFLNMRVSIIVFKTLFMLHDYRKQFQFSFAHVYFKIHLLLVAYLCTVGLFFP
jgi:hypothetical protein